jgi:cytochrome c-type biogenesis protein CcmE
VTLWAAGAVLAFLCLQSSLHLYAGRQVVEHFCVATDMVRIVFSALAGNYLSSLGLHTRGKISLKSFLPWATFLGRIPNLLPDLKK